MKKLFTYALVANFLLMGRSSMAQQASNKVFKDKQIVTISKQSLQDKIKGGWAGQTIGVTFGGPYEFKFLGSMIQDYQKLEWPENAFQHYFDKEPGLYDDIYMDLSFVDVIEKYGVEAPVDSFANAFANAAYPLWHANQVGRYNILHGIKAPASGYWKNNPHADDIDFQIEADFAGLMNPGMSGTASKLCDKVGHIMNYGDGWYGGVYMANLYTQAFVSNDINFVVTEALKAIPAQSTYYQCINDVIKWHQQYPKDWKRTWFEVQKKWTNDLACSEGVFKPFDISSRVNSAYVVMGLLYGNGDFGQTMEIAIRAGQDADCNPSSAAGILGAIIGYDKIPNYWKKNLTLIENRDFVYTNISLNKIYQLGYKHALQSIVKNGGSVQDNNVSIVYQAPVPVQLEQSFVGLTPSVRKQPGWANVSFKDSFSYAFDGDGITVTNAMSDEWNANTDYEFKVEVDLDGAKEIVLLPYNFKKRKAELFAKYQLKEGPHQLKLTLLNPSAIGNILIGDIVVYSNKKTN